jgi:hypothetical protein
LGFSDPPHIPLPSPCAVWAAASRGTLWRPPLRACQATPHRRRWPQSVTGPRKIAGRRISCPLDTVCMTLGWSHRRLRRCGCTPGSDAYYRPHGCSAVRTCMLRIALLFFRYNGKRHGSLWWAGLVVIRLFDGKRHGLVAPPVKGNVAKPRSSCQAVRCGLNCGSESLAWSDGWRQGVVGSPTICSLGKDTVNEENCDRGRSC